MIPYLDVSHLPSSASFYSAVLQPLGLRYVSTGTLVAAADEESKSIITTSPECELARLPVAINYGRGTSSASTNASSPPNPVFQIREARNPREPLKKSRVVFSAPSLAAVTDFHSLTLRANPALLLSPVSHSLSQWRPAALTQSGDVHRAIVTDLDGNTVEVVYQPPPDYPPFYPGSAFRKTQPTHQQVSRILDWNYDVVAASSSSSSSSSASSPSPRSVSDSVTGSSASSRKMSSQAGGGGGGAFPGDQPYTILRRSVTTSVIESPSANKDLIADPASSAASSSVLQTSTVVGSLLGAAVGAAAGAAITYSMLRNERAQAPRQEFDGAGAGSAPAFQRRATFSEQDPDQHPAPRYVEVERTVEKIRYPEAYPTLPDSRVPPQHTAKHSQVGARSRAVDDLGDDGRSRASSRYQLERGTSVRSRSQAPASRAPPMMLTDYEHQSNAGSRFTVTKSAVPRTIVDDAGTYVSARSQSTIRPPPPTVETLLGARSTAPSRAPTRVPSMAPSRAFAPPKAPSRAPTAVPSRAPTKAPSRAPTVAQSRAPTAAPSRAPTSAPTKAPTMVPARAPTVVRTANQQPHFAYPPATRAPTYTLAAHNPMPRSGAGSSHATWEDDAVSVAPSDSISCIGSRTSRRQYH